MQLILHTNSFGYIVYLKSMSLVTQTAHIINTIHAINIRPNPKIHLFSRVLI